MSDEFIEYVCPGNNTSHFPVFIKYNQTTHSSYTKELGNSEQRVSRLASLYGFMHRVFHLITCEYNRKLSQTLHLSFLHVLLNLFIVVKEGTLASKSKITNTNQANQVCFGINLTRN